MKSQVNWDDFRIALQVAESGTLTRAGSILNMNHTTVLRRLNQLEMALGIKLFIRHQRGYQLSDAGKLMFKKLPEIGTQFTQLINDLGSMDQNDHGHLRITTLNGYAPLLNRALEGFRTAFPKTCIQMVVTEKTIPVESGVAHIAIRVGPQPMGPDIVVKKLMDLNIDYYASMTYVQQHGLPQNSTEYNQHFWAMPSGIKQSIPFVQEVIKHLNNEQIIYQSNLFTDLHSVVVNGFAIGSMAEFEAKNYKHLQPLHLDFNQNDEVLWFVYHKDLKNNPKIMAFYQYLLDAFQAA